MASPELEIIYSDEYLLAVNKPAGLPMHSNLDPRRPNLVSLLQERLRQSGESDYLALHQRLDLGTSGVVVLGRRPEANPSLAEQFATHRVGKYYWAIAWASGHLPSTRWECTYPLAAPLQRGGRVRWRRGEVEGDFKGAVTKFRLLRRGGGALLIEAKLESGRKHQVRAHLAAQKMALVGDKLYGAPVEEGDKFTPYPLLHALRLELKHPLSGRPLLFTAPPPLEFRRQMGLRHLGRVEDYE